MVKYYFWSGVAAITVFVILAALLVYGVVVTDTAYSDACLMSGYDRLEQDIIGLNIIGLNQHHYFCVGGGVAVPVSFECSEGFLGFEWSCKAVPLIDGEVTKNGE